MSLIALGKRQILDGTYDLNTLSSQFILFIFSSCHGRYRNDRGVSIDVREIATDNRSGRRPGHRRWRRDQLLPDRHRDIMRI